MSSINKPLYLLNGKEITEQEMKAIDPKTIKSVDVYKDATATSKYGEKGRFGVVSISTKEKNENAANEITVIGFKTNANKENSSGNSLKEVVVEGYKLDKQKPLVTIDGKEVSDVDINDFPSEKIASMNVLKGEKAVEKYGEKGKNGVIEIVTKQENEYDKVFTKVEQPAQFPGGEIAFKKYMERNLKYPENTLKAGTEAVARVQFIVDATGNVSNLKLVSDPGNGLGEEAMKLVKRGPKWQPAMQNGKAVLTG